MERTILPFGTQYYRAPTPLREDWRQDLQNIRGYGFNTIKLLVLWRWSNPGEGRYYFDDLDELMDLAEKNGLKVILNVLFDVVPAWFYQMYPDCVMITCDGRHVEPQVVGHRSTGGAPGPCYNHPAALKARLAFLEVLVHQYKDHPALLIWDLWNEPELTCAILRAPVQKDLVCYCSHCRGHFINWLNKKYGNIHNLNARWHRNYQCWEELELPRNGDAFTDMIDWRIFFADVLTGELRYRIETVKKTDSRTPVMAHTVPMPYFNAVTCCNNDYDMAALCDMFGNSIGSVPFAAAFNTSCADGKNVINSEIHAMGGNAYNRPKIPTFSDIKAHIFTPLARGIKGFIYWQYRPERLGLESPAWGLTTADGCGTPWLEYNRIICASIQNNAQLLLDVKPYKSEVAVLNSYQGQIFDWCASGSTDTYNSSVMGLFNALYAANLNVDIVNMDSLNVEKLSQYKAIILPFPYYLENKVVQLLRDWVFGGGLLISEAFHANANGDTGLYETTVPGLDMDEVFGVREGNVISFTIFEGAYSNNTLTAQIPPIQITLEGCEKIEDKVQGYLFREELVSIGAKVLGRFENGAPAMTVNNYGMGKAVMIGTLLGCAYQKQSGAAHNISKLLLNLVKEHGIQSPLKVDVEELRADLLTSPDGGAVLVINGSNIEKREVEIIICADIGNKTEAVDIITDGLIPLFRSDEGWKLKFIIEPNHHEVYKLV